MSSVRRLTLRFATIAACATLTGAGAVAASAARTDEASARTPAAAQCVQQTLDGMSTAQRVGQLFMVGVSSTAPTSGQLSMITDDHLGGVYLSGNSTAGATATKQVTGKLNAASTGADDVGLWIGTDQEGGQVQRLKGDGFTTMPTALSQGQQDASTLKSDAQTWGGELRSAGLNLNLAPVLDTVPENVGTGNAPIGQYDREYGYTPDVVAAHGTAYLQGEQAAGITTTAKHFPGLGRADGNTDTTAGVKDTETTRDDAYLRPFQTAIDDGAPLVMVSSAIYTKIDPDHVAAFSSTVMTDMLRGDLGFDGVIVTDSMGAAAVSGTPVGQRATDFIAAGGTVVLTGAADDVPTMIDAVTSKIGSDSAFSDKVDAAAEHVLTAKDQAGLLPCSA